MSKTNLFTIAIALLIVMNLALMAFLLYKPADRPAPGMGVRPEGPKKIIIEQLHFNPQQVTQYEVLIGQHRAAVRAAEATIRHTKNALYLTLNDTTTTNSHDSLVQQLGRLQQAIEKIHYDHFEDIRRLCRPDQLPYFNELTHHLAAYFAPENNMPPPPKDR